MDRTETGSLRKVGRDEWCALAATFFDHSYTQTFDYGAACAELRGAISEHVAIVSRGEVIGLADVRTKRIPVVGGGIAYVSGGPLTRRAGSIDPSVLEPCVRTLIAEFTDRRHLVLRLLAPIGPAEENAAIAAVFERCGLLRAPNGRAYRTILLDVKRPPDAIQGDCGRRWRRGLNQALRAPLVLKRSSDESGFAAFIALHTEMQERKGFHTDLDAEFYCGLQGKLPESERFAVVLAYPADDESRACAGIVVSMLGDTAVFLLGASDSKGRDLRASYALHWDAILQARERGLRWYDLGGIDPVANPGVYEFKKGMGGVEVTAAGPHESTLPGWRGKLTTFAEDWLRRRQDAAKAEYDLAGSQESVEPVALAAQDAAATPPKAAADE